ncbi:MAG: DUF389 domain-containing protein [Gemmatimonadaceae bacterium]|jgi:uncharacterized hydrophobic protein (TIGR00271 family)|nr:DUF389 domain-containing protein [Gemmatimonadaceae bacterium]
MASWRALRALVRLRRRIALLDGTDAVGTARRIEDGIPMQGERAWLLLCSCLLASIGLDTGSVAVIIGAMLISPLMSPILGSGLSIAVADRAMLARALRELALATVATLALSSLYFSVTPLGEPTSELIARTRPTLLDVGVALFGGVAGIVAGSRRDQSLALPGVAIATALMPPLCTAGFGLATGRPAFFFGALYLFVLNAIFIALATFAVARVLQFPLRSFTDTKTRRREVRLVSALAVIAIVPSLWFLYTTVRDEGQRRRINQFIDAELASRGREVIRWSVAPRTDSTVVKLYLAGVRLEAATLDSLQTRLDAYGLSSARLEIVQSDISARDLERLEQEVQGEILQAIAIAQAARDSARADAARGLLDAPLNSASLASLVQMVRVTFPEVRAMTLSGSPNLLQTDSASTRPLLLLTLSDSLRPNERTALLGRITSLVQSIAPRDSVLVQLR